MLNYNQSSHTFGNCGVGESPFRDCGVEGSIRVQALNESLIGAASAKAAEDRGLSQRCFFQVAPFQILPCIELPMILVPISLIDCQTFC